MERFTIEFKGNRYTLKDNEKDIKYMGNRDFVILLLMQFINEYAKKIKE